MIAPLIVAPLIVALDGPAASGKGTLARRLAEAFNLAYLDTGSLYRATGVATLRAGGDPSQEADAVKSAQSLDMTRFSSEDLRTEAAGVAASQVAAIPGVRAALLDFQRNFAKNPPLGLSGAVLDGRDIGTVVCPDAPVKIFVVADFETRVARRVKELQEKGENIIEARVRADMEARDARDSNRGVAPLKPAPDAFTLDTSTLDADAVFAQAEAYVASKLKTLNEGVRP
jgi:cytidylate kinase